MSAAEAARAVRDMMGAAGLPLGGESEKLVEECLKLKQALARAEQRCESAGRETSKMEGERAPIY